MASARLFLDEDVRPLLAEILRQRGYDVQHALEKGAPGRSDADQLAEAIRGRRAILTHNIRDFVALDRACQARGRSHFGIVVSNQLPFRELLRRTLRLLARVEASEVRDRVVWLHDFK